MMDAYEVRLEAERIIGEDRVPTELLRELIRDFGDDRAPCTCTLACQPTLETGEDTYCREGRSAENDAPGAFGPGYVYNPAVFGNSRQRRGG